MPSLGLVKDKARNTVCKSNMHQWGLIFHLLTGDNDGKYHSGGFADGTGSHEASGHWMSATRDYYQDPKIRFCASAANPNKPSSNSALSGAFDPRGVWGPWGENQWAGGVGDWQVAGDAGSYGVNSWINNSNTFGADKHWRKRGQKNESKIPVLLDSWWVDAWPEPGDLPPEDENGGNRSMMQRFCFNRHNGDINAVFMDCSSRGVPVKELWNLKWHKSYNTKLEPTWDWPDWMKR